MKHQRTNPMVYLWNTLSLTFSSFIQNEIETKVQGPLVCSNVIAVCTLLGYYLVNRINLKKAT